MLHVAGQMSVIIYTYINSHRVKVFEFPWGYDNCLLHVLKIIHTKH